MSGYIGSKTSVTLVDGYTQAEADAEFVQDPNGAITVSGSNVGIGTSSPATQASVQNSSTSLGLEIDTTSGFASGPTLRGYYRSGSSYNPIAMTGSTVHFGINDVEKMRIDVSGNVGIGTSSPSNTLSLEGSGTGLNINSTNDEVKKIAFENSGVLTGYIGSSTSSPLRFLNGSGTERMRIDSSGNVGIGRTPSYRLDVDSNGSVASGRFNRYTDGSLRSLVIFRSSSNGSNVGGVYINNTSTSYNTSSDYRLKTDAQPMTGASARVQALNPVNFEWIASGDRVDGFLAHEAQEVVPESVTGTKDAMRDEEYEVTAAVEATYDDDGNELTPAVDAVMGTRSVPDYQGIDQSKLVPLLTAALQEALNKIDTMETRLAALEGN